MKTLKNLALVFFILSIGIVFMPEKATAQNELQFSQVLTYVGTASGFNTPTYTVPSNKVWKIEKISSTTYWHTLVINNIKVEGYSHDADNPALNSFWLKAGDTFYMNYDGSSGGYNYFFSIIEYSVVAIQ